MKTTLQIVTILVLCSLSALLPACRSGGGDSGGRIDPYTVTHDEKKSTGVPVSSLLEFSDQTVEALARDVADIEAIKTATTKLVLEMGTLQNKSLTPSGDFEQIQNRVRAGIFQSKFLRERFMVVESRSRMAAEGERLNGAGNPGQPAQYDAKITYTLQGDFFETIRGDREQYFFVFQLTNLATREIVFQRSYDLGRVKD